MRSFSRPRQGRSVWPQRSAIVTMLVAIVAQVAGCTHSNGSRTDSTGTKRASQVVSPLSVSVERPERLTSINLLAIARPVFVRSVADRTLSEESLEGVIGRIADEVLSLKVVTSEGLLSKGGSAQAKGAVDSSVALTALRARGADAVLVTEVMDYQDRAGSSIGGEPATVAFVMTIKSTSDGEPVWRGHYFYRQEAFSDNLLKIGDRLGGGGTGAGWVSGRLLFERGVDMAMRDFGSRREARFLSGASPAEVSQKR